MGILEEELKKRFSNKSNIDNVDTENIWGAISETLDASEESRPNGYIGWIRTAGLVLVIGAVGFYFYSDDEKKSQRDQFNVELNVSSSNAQEYSTRDLNDKIEQNKKGEVSTEFTDKALRSETQLSIEERQWATLIETQTFTTIDSPATLSDDQSIQENELNKNRDRMISMTKNSEVGKSKNHEELKESYLSSTGRTEKSIKYNEERFSDISAQDGLSHNQSQDENKFEAKQAEQQSLLTMTVSNNQEFKHEAFHNMEDSHQNVFPLARIKLCEIDSETRKFNFLGGITKIPTFKNPELYYDTTWKYMPDELAFTIGLDFIIFDFQKSESSFDINSFNKNIPGYSATISSSWIRDKGLRISLGLEYAKFRNEFNYIKESNVLYLDEDRLINYSLDEFTGDTIKAVYQDTWLDAIETRTIMHHNEFSTVTFPFSIGYERNVGKVGLGLDVGLNYGFFLSQKGRSINTEGAIVDFDMSNGSETPFRSSSLSYSISPIIDYHLISRLNLRLSPQVKFLPKEYSVVNGVDLKTKLFRIVGGVVCKL